MAVLGLLPSPPHGAVIPKSWPLSSVWVKRGTSCCIPYPQWGQEACKNIKTAQHGKRCVNLLFSHFHCSKIRKLPAFLRSLYSNKAARSRNASTLLSFFTSHSRLIKKLTSFCLSCFKISCSSKENKCPQDTLQCCCTMSICNCVSIQCWCSSGYRMLSPYTSLICLAVSQETLYTMGYFLSPSNLSSQELRGVSFHLGQ